MEKVGEETLNCRSAGSEVRESWRRPLESGWRGRKSHRKNHKNNSKTKNYLSLSIKLRKSDTLLLWSPSLTLFRLIPFSSQTPSPLLHHLHHPLLLFLGHLLLRSVAPPRHRCLSTHREVHVTLIDSLLFPLSVRSVHWVIQSGVLTVK